MSKNQSFLNMGIFLVVLTILLMGHDASARDKQLVQAEFQAAFEKMYAKPGDVGLALDYAKLAVELEDYESALSPLERLLMINPKLPEVRLELGVMYFKLNSMLVAKEHLLQVVDDGTASEELQQRAKMYLAKL